MEPARHGPNRGWDDLAVVIDDQVVAVQVVVDEHVRHLCSPRPIDYRFEPVNGSRQLVASVDDPRVVALVAQDLDTPLVHRRARQVHVGDRMHLSQRPAHECGILRSASSSHEWIYRVARGRELTIDGTHGRRHRKAPLRELIEHREVGRRVAPPDFHEPRPVDDERVSLEPASVRLDRCSYDPVVPLKRRRQVTRMHVRKARAGAKSGADAFAALCQIAQNARTDPPTAGVELRANQAHPSRKQFPGSDGGWGLFCSGGSRALPARRGGRRARVSVVLSESFGCGDARGMMSAVDGGGASSGAGIERRRAHTAVGGVLGGLDDRSLRKLVERSQSAWRAWGGSHSIVVEGHPVFVKRVPLTDLELAEYGTTCNIFELPLFYCYGVGSAGFGAFRELGIHQKTTQMVLSGTAEGFPLLHHHRVMTKSGAVPPFPMDLDGYVAYWNDNRAVRRYMEARQAAGHELWLFAERFPHVVDDWHPTNQDRSNEIVEALCDVAVSLRQHGIVHFDAHFGNALTDGRTFYLADFGLAIDADFDVDVDERRFLDRHRHYDQGLILWCLGYSLVPMYHALEPAALDRARKIVDLPRDASQSEILVATIDNANALTNAGVFALDADLVNALGRYRDVIIYMAEFLEEMRKPTKAARYDDNTLADLLEAAGIN